MYGQVRACLLVYSNQDIQLDIQQNTCDQRHAHWDTGGMMEKEVTP
jgi:hypothetical protein